MKIKPGVFWPAVIAGALVLHVAAMMVMVWISTSDASYAVEPDYYQKALHWDDKRAQDRANTKLGWMLDFVVEPAAPGSDPRLRITLVDDAGSPVTGAVVSVEAFSNIRRDDVLTATLAAAADGYEAPLPMRGNGRWEFRFQITRDEDLFTYRDIRHVWTHMEEGR